MAHPTTLPYLKWVKLSQVNQVKGMIEMQSVNMHEAKTHLSALVERAVNGDEFIIAKAGKPMVKVVRYDAPSVQAVRRIGFMTGEIRVPDDFDRMGEAEIEHLFGSVA